MLSRLARIARKAFKAAGFTDWETRPVWGDTAPRILTRDFRGKMLAMNRKPWICNGCGNAQKENVECEQCGLEYFHRRRSFPSLIDWLDDMPAGIIDQDGNKLDPIAVLAEFLDTLRQCDQMTHILCTKRPQNFRGRLNDVCRHLEDHPPAGSDSRLWGWILNWVTGEHIPKNIIVLASVENQEQADKRIPQLLKIPSACRGLSLEPLLGEVVIADRFLGLGSDSPDAKSNPPSPKIGWLIIGGESGPQARPCNVDWIRSLVKQGHAAGVATFVKQLGPTPKVGMEYSERINGYWEFGDQSQVQRGEPGIYQIFDKKGGNPAEWPADLRVQQWPVLKD